MLRRLAPSATVGQGRLLSTRGQYNPIHSFDVSKPAFVAKDIGEFRKLISNPGPIAVTFNQDYLDWYFRGYNEKVRRFQLRAKEGESNRDESNLMRIPSSARRQIAEQQRGEAQRAIDGASVEHGMLDCYERQPQFPCIHVDRCTDFHIAEILKSMFFDECISASALWEKALLYRAMLIEREQAYPDSFRYAVDAAQAVEFAEETVSQTPELAQGKTFKNADVLPTPDAAAYFQYIVKKYNLQNTAECDVVLRCLHREDAEEVLRPTQPPKEDASASVPAKPAQDSYPPLEAMLSPKNMPLARALIFAEFNCVASVNPFAKFPGAAAIVTRPTASELKAARGTGVGIANAIANARGALFAKPSTAQANMLEARHRDAERLQTIYANSDANFVRDIPSLAEENPEWFAADNGYFNPRTIRAEVRDATSRKVMSSLEKYESARKQIHRATVGELDSRRRSRFVGLEDELSPTSPSKARYSALLLDDKHISFAIAVSNSEASAELRTKVANLAQQLFSMAMEYHKADVRTVLRDKSLVFMSLVDDAVTAALQQTQLQSQVQALGTYVPLTKRLLDDAGFPTSARADDYKRWMQAGRVYKAGKSQ